MIELNCDFCGGRPLHGWPRGCPRCGRHEGPLSKIVTTLSIWLEGEWHPYTSVLHGLHNVHGYYVVPEPWQAPYAEDL